MKVPFNNKIKNILILLILGLCCLLSACTYIQNANKQNEYAKIQETNPSQRNLKHMIDRQNFFVYGQILSRANQFTEQFLVVAAFSDRFKKRELVDVAQVAHIGTHYGLNLPDGSYNLLVLADHDSNGVVDESEVIGQKLIELSVEERPEKVADDIDIELLGSVDIDWNINIPLPKVTLPRESLFYPKGTLRSLDDSLFDSDVATLGIYAPAEFLQKAPTMFYALEEDSYKIPVLFVHGIGGSPQEFDAMVNRMDRQHYMPWFFYYPSGRDLDQLATFFYKTFLSGKVIPLGEKPIIIVAHSLGGLVVREALNKLRDNGRGNTPKLVVTIASPFGGHPAAASGLKNAPLVIPSWRDLSPDSHFIEKLFRKPLPGNVDHQLFYAYGNTDKLKFGENSDGVVPLSSQLHPVAQQQSSSQFGFDNNHSDVLKDEDVIDLVIRSINQIKSFLPDSHVKILSEGGYSTELSSRYSERETYYVRTIGKYMSALATGKVEHLDNPDLKHFVDVTQGKAKPKTDAETAWLKFIEDYPDIGE